MECSGLIAPLTFTLVRTVLSLFHWAVSVCLSVLADPSTSTFLATVFTGACEFGTGVKFWCVLVW